ncbi:MAG: beta-ketoacyl-[acyl-carrier-protein] synthase family protein, partial [Planctomycetota bacterium]
FWSNVKSGQSGIGPITLFDASAFPVRIGGEVKDFHFESVTNEFPDSNGFQDRKVFFALAAAQEAVTDARLSNGDLREALLQVGVGLEVFRLEDLTPYADSSDLGHSIVSTLIDDQGDRLLQTPLDCTSIILGDRYGLLAGRYTNCSACAAGAQVIGESWQMLREGMAKVALAGSTDSMLNPLGLGGFSLLRVLSDENEKPRQACRPFDASRKGTVLGEGAAFVVLETLDNAMARGANVYAELVGYGSSMDAFRVSDPDKAGRGAVHSMKEALTTAGLKPGEIDCVNAHGTGTVKNDIVETAAIKESLGPRAYEIPVYAVKSMTGHMVAASGAVETVVAALTIRHRVVPPTINLNKADDQCDLDYVADGARQFAGDTVLSNSFGFGGQNATLILRRYA